MIDRQLHMLKLAKEAMKNAYAPYSMFKVGVALRTDTGRYFSGCNIENASYRLTLCAESAAIGQMITAGENRIEAILIVSSTGEMCPPCGACRQSLREFADGNCKIHVCTGDKITKTYLLDELLPASFSAAHFNGDTNA